jgi:hypothetical protein
MEKFTDYTERMKEIAALLESLLEDMECDESVNPHDSAAIIASFCLVDNRIPVDY